MACQECAVQLDTLMSLGGLDGPGVASISPFSTVATDASGRILVASRLLSDQFAVFDANGRYVTSVGRAGDGPGEYRFISAIAAGPRYLHVLDDAQSRRTMLSYDFEVVRTDRLPGHAWSAAALESDAVVFSAALPTPQSVSHPLHVLDTDGVLASFGAANDRVHRGRTTVMYVNTGRGTVWAVAERSYELQEWRAAPVVHQRTVSVRAKWFEDDDEETFPRSLLLGAVPAGDTLWVIGRAPDRRWTGRAVPGQDPSVPIEDPINIWDGVLDAVDLRTGRRLAHLRVEAPFLGAVSGGDLIVQYGEDRFGIPYVHLVRPALAAPPHLTPSEGGGR